MFTLSTSIILGLGLLIVLGWVILQLIHTLRQPAETAAPPDPKDVLNKEAHQDALQELIDASTEAAHIRLSKDIAEASTQAGAATYQAAEAAAQDHARAVRARITTKVERAEHTRRLAEALAIEEAQRQLSAQYRTELQDLQTELLHHRAALHAHTDQLSAGYQVEKQSTEAVEAAEASATLDPPRTSHLDPDPNPDTPNPDTPNKEPAHDSAPNTAPTSSTLSTSPAPAPTSPKALDRLARLLAHIRNPR